MDGKRGEKEDGDGDGDGEEKREGIDGDGDGDGEGREGRKDGWMEGGGGEIWIILHVYNAGGCVPIETCLIAFMIAGKVV